MERAGCVEEGWAEECSGERHEGSVKKDRGVN